jgi:phosphate/sulfate permease
MVAIAVGAVLGLAAAGTAASANSLEALLGLVVFIVVLPVIGGIFNAIRTWLNYDPEDERPSTTTQRSGQSAVVAGGLFLGAVLGMLFGLGLGG